MPAGDYDRMNAVLAEATRESPLDVTSWLALADLREEHGIADQAPRRIAEALGEGKSPLWRFLCRYLCEALTDAGVELAPALPDRMGEMKDHMALIAATALHEAIMDCERFERTYGPFQWPEEAGEMFYRARNRHDSMLDDAANEAALDVGSWYLVEGADGRLVIGAV
jgi:hypothetical protein